MKKLLLSLLFALVALTGLHAQTIWDGTADTEWYDETSAEFEISTAKQLAGLAKLVNNGNDFSYQTVRLTADIVLNNTSEWENWESSAPANTWTPIGNSDNYFRGTFDGQGYTVSGIYINSANGDQGLFGYNQGIIKNIGVTESYIKGEYSVGGVCSSNFGIISNCYNSGTVSGNRCVGGVCSSNYVTISNCYNTGTISGYEEVGGVCSGNNGTISNCYNSGTVSGNDYVGGVCGDNGYGTISGCYNAGTVSGNDYNVGGVCSSNYGTISNCYNSGTVSGNRYVGGVCSENNGTISNCYYLQGTAEGGINGSDISGQAEAKTAEQFASGEVCWLLNGSSDANPTWFQTLGTDNAPLFDNTHGTVYSISNCPNSATYNNNGPSNIRDHSDSNNDGRCDFCGQIILSEPAQSNGIYQIGNRAELYWFAGLVNGSLDGVEQNTAANAVLTADIIINENVLDAKGNLTENTENLLIWIPIGDNSSNPFSGTFDGQGHTVSGIYINSENDYQGLFGHNIGRIRNVGLTNSYIKGDNHVGGVCGDNDGSIYNCYNTGTVKGGSYIGGVCGRKNNDGTYYSVISYCYNAGTVNGNNYVGGVCGYNSNGTISNCYNAGAVNGNDRVGGVCGYNCDSDYGTISNCYNSGTVNGNSYVGGVCGSNGYYGTISNCYYLESSAEGGITGEDISGQAEVKTSEQFALGEVCWLLNGSSDANPVWFQTLDTDDYPVLDDAHATVYTIVNCPNDTNNTYSNQGPSHIGEHADNDHDFRCDYCGMVMLQEPELSEGVYQISNLAELYWFAGLVNGSLSGVEQNREANAVLTSDITINENVLDANGNLTESTDDLLVWSPIGNSINEFYGIFDGQGHIVKGIYINTVNSYQGLFGYNNGTIKNVGVSESYIKGDYGVGGVCGNNEGTISNCYNSGIIIGNNEIVGGVCSRNGGSIYGCYNSGTVSGYIYVGGVCGDNWDGTISNCYNSGTINGDENVGGVCGFSDGSISNCYNTGTVSGTGTLPCVGGVCGNNYSGTISNCYNSGDVSGTSIYAYIGGVCGANRGTISDCYNSGTVSGTGDYADTGGVCGHNYDGTISNCYYLQGTATGGINGSDVSGQAEAKTAEQFASGEVCWLLNEEQSEGAWGQKLGTDPYPVLGGPAVFKDGDIYYNEEGSAIVETNSEQASFVIVSENMSINIYGSDGEATVYNLAGNIVYNGLERIIPVETAGMYIVRIGDEIQKTVVR